MSQGGFWLAYFCWLALDQIRNGEAVSLVLFACVLFARRQVFSDMESPSNADFVLDRFQTWIREAYSGGCCEQ
jgi:hypothetical protein